MFAQLAGQVKTDGCLDLTASDGMFLVVVRQTRRLSGDTLKDIVYERVHDAHGLAGDASVWMDLFQDLVYVDRITLFTRLSLGLLAALTLWSARTQSWLLFSFLCGYFPRHFDDGRP